MASKAPTHKLLLRKVPVQSAPPGVFMDQAQLFRLPEGLLVAQANDALLQFGEDPQHAQMRRFIDHKHAVAKIRELANRDWAVTSGEDPAAKDFLEKAKEYAANIVEDDGNPRIIPANEAGSIAKPFLKQ